MRCLVASILSIAPLAAAEVAPPAPAEAVIVTEQAPDLARLRERLQAGPLGKIWALPELAPLKQRLDDQIAQIDAKTGIDPWALVGDVDAFRAEIVAAPERAGSGRPPLATRFALSFGSQAEPLWTALTALVGGTADQASLKLGELACKRDGHWLLGGDGTAPRAVAAVASAPADADFWARIDCDAVWTAFSLPGGAAAAKVFGLSTLEESLVLAPDGAHETARMPGAKLPLAVIDAAALAALPADAIMVDAIGIDGERLDAQLAELTQASKKIADAVAQAELASGDLGLGDLHALLRGLTGTAALAITSGSPFPGVTVMIPASPELDRLLDTLATRQGFPLAQARGQAVVVPLPPQVPLTLQIRRTATHWVASTDMLALERLAATPAPSDGFDAKAKTALALGGPGEARLLMWQDNQAVARLAQAGVTLASAGMRRGRGGDQAQLMQDIARALGAAAPKLEPTVGALVVDADGATLRGRNLLMQSLVAGIGAGMALPAIQQMRVAARRSASGNNERQLVLGCLVYANENEGKWPSSLEALAKEEGMPLPATVFTSPSAPEIAGAYLYVRPVPEAAATQPVVVEDPACNRGRGSMVTFADGHVQYVPGTTAWTEARRLSQLPKAKDAGIAPEDWAPLNPQREAAQRAADPAPVPPPGKAEF